MIIGIDCFEEVYIKASIEKIGERGTCDITHKDGYVLDTTKSNAIKPILENFLTNFGNLPKGYVLSKDEECYYKYLADFLIDLEIISSKCKESVNKIIQSICYELFEKSPELFTEKIIPLDIITKKDFVKKESILKGSSWDVFCNTIKHINRFHFDMFNFDILETYINNLIITIEEGTDSFYRARICDEKNYLSGFKKEEMGPPPEDKITEGRTNPDGVVCLYLANDKLTTFYETRARSFDTVSVGQFKAKKKMLIADLTILDKVGLFNESEDTNMTNILLNRHIVKAMAEEVRKPIKRYDKTINYLPTQYICDFIKSKGFDGIKFDSTLYKGGINYSFFYPNDFECINVELYKINSVNFDYDIQIKR